MEGIIIFTYLTLPQKLIHTLEEAERQYILFLIFKFS